ncbi:uncharacterized protein [Elaeis guineensis]|uniref:Uncharacterized protein LOC105043405 n=1 Tax=Elaeis guineensis var. tenera TaxID=51953 RepID=A0A6I9R2B7_ELAGV|nr:uncharacterized protein LOC105043405 [Elaeis guineensis]
MPLSQTQAAAPAVASGGGKRRKGRPAGSRARKKQKRLDAICDTPSGLSIPGIRSPEDDSGRLRRSSRVRRAPAVLDASPTPSHRRKRSRDGDSPIRIGGGGSRKRRKKKGRMRRNGDRQDEGKALLLRRKETSLSPCGQETKDSEVEAGNWRSRLRSRVAKVGSKAPFFGEKKHLRASGRVVRKKKEPSKPVTKEGMSGLDSPALGSKRGRRKRVSSDEISEGAEEPGDRDVILPSDDGEDSGQKASPEDEIKAASDLQLGCESNEDLQTAEQAQEVREQIECMNVGGEEKVDQPFEQGTAYPIFQVENTDLGKDAANLSGEHLNSKAVENEEILKDDYLELPISQDKLTEPHVKEGRRCGLCGGGTDGKPPKRLVHESMESDNEAYEGSSASEEPNYDVWDGFGDEPGWLGRLLGPIRDRFGMARVWVHQHCAVWSPEVYFAGLGCLRNVRAALCRGRVLKCSRCGRPGATIGCRVDRCPKTYHLPCGRADGCIFDHRKFLIACNDHRHLFQPQGESYSQQIRKMKFKKLKLDMRKLSHDTWRKDLEAEEKWLENCGEDEEFLKREGKRLHRDLLRIAPVYIGGSYENGKSYQGWESVAGLQDVIQCLKEVVLLPLLYPEFFSTLGITPPRGVLLHGYPGTGKTLVVRALIGACSRGEKRIAYFARKGADCLGKYVGDAERQLRLLFQVAEKSQPSIIFFDEIDGLAPYRSRHQDQTHNSVVSTLLSLLDGLKSRGSVIVIGATNRPDAVDPALRRPGRFDREIYFPLPTLKDRAAILSLHTRNWPNPVSGSLLSWIANQTAGYAGADLQSLCTQAAMNALKRNCALQELLSSAEKGSDHLRLPPLPEFVVEERDWLKALALAPPPCSRREAGMAANDVVSSPLHSHLVPCLLKPLSHLLISFYIDGRIWLPPSFRKALQSIESIIVSALEQRSIPAISWWCQLHSLTSDPYFANEIVKVLSRYGLVMGPSGSGPSYPLEDDNDVLERFASSRSETSDSCTHRESMQKSLKLGNTSGFRTLIAGTPRSGQQHLASCLLHGYVGHVNIQKVDLATISQEGHGDIILGLTQILMKCLNVGRCIIYMPRIDLWAIDETCGEDAKQSEGSANACKSSQELGVDVAKNSSQAWNSFVEQVDSVCASGSINILATCEMQNHDLPPAIRLFFSSDAVNHADSAPSEHIAPRFLMCVDGNFNPNQVIDSCAAKLSEDLVQHYAQLVHHRTHISNSHDKNEVFPAVKANIEPPRLNMDTSVDAERTVSNAGASCRDKETQQVTNGDQRWSPPSKMRVHDKVDLQLDRHKGSVPRIFPGKTVKGSSMLAIATFGYQILRYPQFAELCWITSKLTEGPSADIKGPWKGWPFNSCLMDSNSSSNKVVAGASASNLKNRENSGVVRGLVAVGLLAYKGVYTSVREVSVAVRRVLELLVGQVRAKILGRKDKYRYLRLLSQVAYLEDIVISWAYTFQSVQTDNQITMSNTKSVITESLYVDNNLSSGNIVHDPLSMRSVPNVSCNEEVSPKGSPHKVVTSNGECADFNEGTSPSSDTSIIPDVNHFQEPNHSSFHPGSTSAATTLNGDGTHGSRSPSPGKKLADMKHVDGLGATESNIPAEANMSNLDSSVAVTMSCSKEASDKCNCLDNHHSSSSGGHVTDELGTVSEFTHRKSNELSVVSGTACQYCCCSRCLCAIYVLVRRILYDCWRPKDHYSTIDDIHDLLASCSLRLLAAVRKSYISQSSSSSEECFGKNQHQRVQSECCACQDIVNKQVKKMVSRHMVHFIPTECSCHIRNEEDSEIADNESISLLQSALNFFFRDGVLMPSYPHKEAVLHCRFEKLCVCSILEMILMIKKPLC